MATDWTETTPITPNNLNSISPQNAVYPVGSIYMNANTGENPSTLLGFGTWERFGEGRVLVSQDSTDTDFDTAEKTGGAKTHTLFEAEMPSHNHSGSASTDGDHNHAYEAVRYKWNEGNGIVKRDDNGDDKHTYATATNGDHSHSISIGNTGGGSAHNNLQPYITVYMWVRTA